MPERSAAMLHGGLLEDELARLELRHEDVLDASVNVNPYGGFAPVIAAIRTASVERYPDPTAAPARAALARWLDLPRERFVVGNGAVDLLWSLARCLLQPGDSVLVVEPAFSELRRAAVSVGARVLEHRLHPEDDFSFDPTALMATVRALRPRLLYVSTPGNPTGKTTPVEFLVRLADQHPETTFVVDLSFSSLSQSHRDDVVRASARIVWLRSLTKDLALAGLRVGFAVLPEPMARRIESSRPPWSVNGLSQAAVCAATSAEAQAFVANCRAHLLADRAALDLDLERLGLGVHPSETIYSLVALGPQRRATDLRDALLARHAILIRDATSFGLPHHVRICARPRAESVRLIHALAQELNR